MRPLSVWLFVRLSVPLECVCVRLCEHACLHLHGRKRDLCSQFLFLLILTPLSYFFS